MVTTLTKFEQFFYDNAGYSIGETDTIEEAKERCAQELANAEAKALELGYWFNWERDECIGCDCGNEECPCFNHEMHESYACVLYDEDGELLDSLGSICQPTNAYRRMVQAELAMENI